MKVSEQSVKQMIEENSHNKYTTLCAAQPRTSSCSKSTALLKFNLISITGLDLNSMKSEVDLSIDKVDSQEERDMPSSMKKKYQGFLEEVFIDSRLIDMDFTSEHIVSDFGDQFRPLQEVEPKQSFLWLPKDAQAPRPDGDFGKENHCPQVQYRPPVSQAKNVVGFICKEPRDADIPQNVVGNLSRANMSFESPSNAGGLKQIVEEASVDECEANISSQKAMSISVQPSYPSKPASHKPPPTRSCLLKPRTNRSKESARTTKTALNGTLENKKTMMSKYSLGTENQFVSQGRSPPAQKANQERKIENNRPPLDRIGKNPMETTGVCASSIRPEPPRNSNTTPNLSNNEFRHLTGGHFENQSRSREQERASTDIRSKSSQSVRKGKALSFKRDLASKVDPNNRGYSAFSSNPFEARKKQLISSNPQPRESSTRFPVQWTRSSCTITRVPRNG